jgi:hypothetical protein
MSQRSSHEAWAWARELIVGRQKSNDNREEEIPMFMKSSMRRWLVAVLAYCIVIGRAAVGSAAPPETPLALTAGDAELKWVVSATLS